MLDIGLSLMKMELYAADETTRNWFRSFLCGRTQRVRVNQLSAEIKLIEGWKSIHVEGCPIEIEPYKHSNLPDYNLRPKTNRIFRDTARLEISQASFNIDAAKIWNGASTEIYEALTLSGAKKEIKKYCEMLPV